MQPWGNVWEERPCVEDVATLESKYLPQSFARAMPKTDFERHAANDNLHSAEQQRQQFPSYC